MKAPLIAVLTALAVVLSVFIPSMARELPMKLRAAGKGALHLMHFDHDVRPNREARRQMHKRLNFVWMLADERGSINLAAFKGRSISEMIAEPRPFAGGDGNDDPEPLYADDIKAQVEKVTGGGDSGLTVAELEALEATLVERIQELGADESVETAVLAQIKEDIDAVRAELTAATEAAAAAAAERAAILEAAAQPSEEGDEETPEETPEGEEETPEASAEETPEETPAEETPENVAASTDKPKRTPIAHINRRRGGNDVPARTEGGLAIIAAGDVPGHSAGDRIEGMDALSDAFARKAAAAARAQGSYHVATIELDYPEERRLGSDVKSNDAKLDAVTSPQAVIAAGICAPLDIDYTIEATGVTDRPIRDALARYQANRGGVQYTPPFTIDDVTSGVRRWTDANAESAVSDSNVRKPVFRVECPEQETAQLYAVPMTMEIDNFQARFRPELFPAVWQQGKVFHSRFAEELLWDELVDNSTTVTTQQILGASTDCITGLERAAAAIRHRLRLAPNMPLRALIPAWFQHMFRVDLTRQMPGDGVGSVSLEQVNSYFADRAINVSWVLDDPNDPFAAQSDNAPLLGWPDDLHTLLFPEGTHVFLDGGTLDLGLEIRDSALNARNAVQAFLETFEGTFKRGHTSYEVIFQGICANGEKSGTTDITPAVCTSDS